MVTALTVYPTNVATTTLSTAAGMVIVTGGAEGGNPNTIGTSTGYGECLILSGQSSWPALGSIGSPSGKGLLWDVTTLEGQQIVAGNWTPTMRFKVSVGSIVATILVRAYKYNGGTYTQIGSNMSLAAQTITTTATGFAFSATSQPVMNFGTGDKLYADVWLNITTNSTGSGTATVSIFTTTSATLGNAFQQIVTPGYQPTPGGVTHRIICDGYGGMFV